MSHPYVSVVMSCFNEENKIHDSIYSIVEQTWDNWELIVVDDGSTDRSIEIVGDIMKRDSRVRLLRNECNMGLAASLNRGIRAAKYDFIARADADDLCLKERLATQVRNMLDNPEIDILGSGAFLCNGDSRTELVLPTTHEELSSLSFLKTMFVHPSVMIRRRFFERIGFYNEALLRAQDKELWIRGLRGGAKYANLAVPLIVYNTDGYIRSWRSIFARISALSYIVNQYDIRFGHFLLVRTFLYSAAIKLRLIQR